MSAATLEKPLSMFPEEGTTPAPKQAAKADGDAAFEAELTLTFAAEMTRRDAEKQGRTFTTEQVAPTVKAFLASLAQMGCSIADPLVDPLTDAVSQEAKSPDVPVRVATGKAWTGIRERFIRAFLLERMRREKETPNGVYTEVDTTPLADAALAAIHAEGWTIHEKYPTCAHCRGEVASLAQAFRDRAPEMLARATQMCEDAKEATRQFLAAKEAGRR